MKNHIRCTLALLLVVAAFPAVGGYTPARGALLPTAALLPAWAAPPPSGVIGPDLARALDEAAPDDLLPVIVLLREQADPQRLARSGDRDTARARLVAGLQALADRTQAPLRAYLDQAQAAGLVTSYTPLWILNGVAVRARPAAIRAIAAHAAVAAVRLDHYRQWLPTAELQGVELGPRSATSHPEWNVSRVRADEVWHSLHISGTGAVVAGMDTGVDWTHPALQANYRGYDPGGSDHTGNWFDAVSGSSEPFDDHGHGTHTIGTAVGRGGIGVAPGARWIAVKVLNGQGMGLESWIHAGFQWLLAPGGDPDLAPDVVNCSWGSDDGFSTEFQPDLQLLRAAGILPVFSNGNNGPGEGTVGSPASLPGSLAVGASDDVDEIADFSSRGPSPWGDIRPHISAPGVYIRSSFPAGGYASGRGTSMAAPHVSGIAALLRAVSPTLSVTDTARIITSTALPLGDPVPNNDAGWGLVDGFSAVASLVPCGSLAGTVRRAGDGALVAGATVTAAVQSGGGWGATTSDEAGTYTITLAPGTYDLAASAFGYVPTATWGVKVVTDATTIADLELVPLPTGTLRGRVSNSENGSPLSSTIAVLSTPLATVGSVYTFALPAGTYTVRARRLGYRIVTATVAITVGETVTVDLALPPAPTILLVDSGSWYYRSEASYYRQALDDLAYAYDEWPIRHITASVPTVADLVPYDVLIWSSPLDSPGYIQAHDVISGYLATGGRLFLSGQDVGYLESTGYHLVPYYYAQYLYARYVRDDAGSRVLEGTPGDLFAGTTITIAGPGGADNQTAPDEVSVLDADYAAPVLAYRGDGWGGIRAGVCRDYRALYLAFGFEAINSRAARREVMDRALTWMVSAPPPLGLQLTPATQSRIALPGAVVTHTLRVRNSGQGGAVDTVHLTVEGAKWATELQTSTVVLPSCTAADVILTVTIPLTAGWSGRDELTVTASSSLSPSLVQTSMITTKSPAPILLVEDDRFYEQRERYEAGMEGAGLPYDTWQTCPAVGSCMDEHVELGLLQRYPIVVWWTGYDWFRPVSTDQRETLTSYLEGGGRLLLSAQDFLYYHHESDFSRVLLGVLTYTEDVTSTLVRGVPEDPIGWGLGPYELDYPFPNGSDGVVPASGTRVILRDQNGYGAGVARREGDHATVFCPFPLEALPNDSLARSRVMERAVGWLSWLGGSSFRADREAVAPGGVLTYTLRVANDGPLTTTASLSNSLPDELELVSDTLDGPATYDPLARRVSWVGLLEPGAVVTVTYRVTAVTGLSTSTPVTNAVRLGLEEQGIHFRRDAVVRVDAPDLSPAALWFSPSTVSTGGTVTGTLVLLNAGPADALTATVVNLLPAGAGLVSGSLVWQGGGVADVLSGTVLWSGPLSAGGRVTVVYRLALPASAVPRLFYSVAFVEDGAGSAWERAAWVQVEPLRLHLPVVMR